MADLINFSLPNIGDGTNEKELKQIKNYLFQLTEQMKFYLNNIDADNYNDAYAAKMSQMTNVIGNVTVPIEESQKRIINNISQAKELASTAIKNGGKGYVVFNDADGDSFNDEILIMDTSDKDTAQKLWRWNSAGLAFSNNGYDGDYSDAAIFVDDTGGHINADYITAGTLQGIEIIASKGTIGGWNISPREGDNDSEIWQRRIIDSKSYLVELKNDAANNEQKKVFFINTFDVDSDGNDISNTKQEPFYIKRNGYLLASLGKIGAWEILSEDNQGALMSEIKVSDDTSNNEMFRAWICPYEKRANHYERTWAFSTQHKANGDVNVYGTFHVDYTGTLVVNEWCNVDVGAGWLRLNSSFIDLTQGNPYNPVIEVYHDSEYQFFVRSNGQIYSKGGIEIWDTTNGCKVELSSSAYNSQMGIPYNPVISVTLGTNLNFFVRSSGDIYTKGGITLKNDSTYSFLIDDNGRLIVGNCLHSILMDSGIYNTYIQAKNIYITSNDGSIYLQGNVYVNFHSSSDTPAPVYVDKNGKLC